jgi:hypothetical protein
MVLAVSQLHEAVGNGRVEAATGGAIESDPLHGQIVDLTGGVPEVGLEVLPGVGVAESLQDQSEPIVGKVDVADGLSGDGFERVAEFVGPAADENLSVIGVGKDVGDPDGDEPPQGEPLMEGVWCEGLVKEIREAEFDQETEE